MMGVEDLIGSDVTITTGVGSETLTHTGTTSSSKDVTVSNKYIDAITLTDAIDGSGGLASNYQIPDLNFANAPVDLSSKLVGINARKIYDGSLDLTGKVTIETGIEGEELSYSNALASDMGVADTEKYIQNIQLENSPSNEFVLSSNYHLPNT